MAFHPATTLSPVARAHCWAPKQLCTDHPPLAPPKTKVEAMVQQKQHPNKNYTDHTPQLQHSPKTAPYTQSITTNWLSAFAGKEVSLCKVLRGAM